MRMIDEMKAIVEMANLKDYADTFLKDNYDMTMEIPLNRNNRLTRSLGRFVSSRDDKPVKIDLAGYLLDNGTYDDVIGTLKHELIHYALFSKGEPYRDGNPHFESHLVKHGAPATRTLIVKREVKMHTYKCKCRTYERRSKLRDITRYGCGSCNVKLTYVGFEKKFI